MPLRRLKPPNMEAFTTAQLNHLKKLLSEEMSNQPKAIIDGWNTLTSDDLEEVRRRADKRFIEDGLNAMRADIN